MKNHPNFSYDDQSNKLYVVFGSDTVVQPLTMMIKHLHTSIAFLAMMRILTYEGFTGFAEEFMPCGIEQGALLYFFFMKNLDTIGWIYFRNDDPQSDLNNTEKRVEDEENHDFGFPMFLNGDEDSLTKSIEEEDYRCNLGAGRCLGEPIMVNGLYFLRRNGIFFFNLLFHRIH